jgi:hypothetical protein
MLNFSASTIIREETPLKYGIMECTQIITVPENAAELYKVKVILLSGFESLRPFCKTMTRVSERFLEKTSGEN